MYEKGERMTDRTAPPDEKALCGWMGEEGFRHWKYLLGLIEERYPGVFPGNDWIFGGAKHGWSLRFRKSKSFCTLIPERGQLVLLFVFGGAERKALEPVLPRLSSEVREAYETSPTYTDGTWLALPVDEKVLDDLDDLDLFLAVKRKSSAGARGNRR